ncbi:MAG TPA: biotin transporter BioY [Gemmatimonadaceae bacterium]|jgi:biotin transport system substrate-specific component|nr:biotin transporter BioY [Gemmatimonadaceae bacterium]
MTSVPTIVSTQPMNQTLVRARALPVHVLGVVGFAAALALASQVAVPLPGTPVPLTLQPMLMVLAGLWLGPRAAAASMALYLVAGMAGLPVFTPGGAPGIARLLGPTGGYLLAYPVAAALTGWLGMRARSFAGRTGAAVAGMLTIYVGGLAQLAVLTGSFELAVVIGVLPFVALDMVKSLVAAALVSSRADRARA